MAFFIYKTGVIRNIILYMKKMKWSGPIFYKIYYIKFRFDFSVT